MAITNLTSTDVNGIRDLGVTQQNIGNGVNASATDEVLLFRAPVATQNTTGTVTLTNCAIKAGDIDVWLQYGNNTQTTSTITLRDCYVEWNIAAVRRNTRITSLIGTHIRATNTGGSAFLYTQAGNVIKPLSQYAGKRMVVCSPPADTNLSLFDLGVDHITERHIPYGLLDLVRIGLRLLPLRFLDTRGWGGDGDGDKVCSLLPAWVYSLIGGDVSGIPKLAAPAEVVNALRVRFEIEG